MIATPIVTIVIPITKKNTITRYCLITFSQGLTQVEEMLLISAVMPIMSLYRLPQGQYGYTGHVVNLPQDVASFAQSLPRLPSDLDVIVAVCCLFEK